MVLVIDGKIINFNPDELRAVLRDHPCSNEALKFQKKSIQVIENNKYLLYLHQREMGTIAEHDPAVCFIGMDDATTCHFIVLDCLNAGLIGAAHLDGCDTELFFDTYVGHIRKAFNKNIYLKNLTSTDKNQKVKNDEQNALEVSVFVVGGFTDDRGLSAKLSTDILMVMANKYPDINFQLELFCVTDLNSRVHGGYNFPIITGAMYNTRVHKIYPASFSNYAKEPQHILRSTRFCCPETIYNIYNMDDRCLYFNNFSYNGNENRDYYLQLSKASDTILRKFSTSPRQEKEGYEDSLRDVFKFMYDNPEPKISVYDREFGIQYICNTVTGEWEETKIKKRY